MKALQYVYTIIQARPEYEFMNIYVHEHETILTWEL